MYRNITPASLILSLLGFAALPAPAYAQWEIYKFLDAGAIATDNLLLGTDNDEVIFSVKPSVELEFKGNRFKTDFLGEVEIYRFGERGDDIVDPRFSVLTDGEVVQNLLYLNASLDIGKVLPGDDFFDLTEARDTQARFKFNPFIARQLGQTADLYIGFGHQSLDNEFDGDIEFTQNTLSGTLRRNPRFGGFIWGIGGTYENSRVTVDGAPEQDFDNKTIFASLGHTVGQTTFFEIIAGQERNDITEINLVDDSAAYYEARLHWTPSERTTVIAGFSDRFFGEGPTLSLQHRIRNSTLSAGWTRDINNADVTLGSVTPFSGETVSQTPITSVVTNDATDRRLFVAEQLRVGYKLAGLRSDLILDAVYQDQDEIEGQGETSEFIGRVAVDRHLSPLTTVRFQYEHRTNEELEGDTENENRLGVRLFYNFDRKERTSILE